MFKRVLEARIETSFKEIFALLILFVAIELIFAITGIYDKANISPYIGALCVVFGIYLYAVAKNWILENKDGKEESQ